MTNPVVLYGTQSNGETLPVQVDATGRLVAEGLQGQPGPPGEEGPPGPNELLPYGEEGSFLVIENGVPTWSTAVTPPDPPGPAHDVMLVDDREEVRYYINDFGVYNDLQDLFDPFNDWDEACRSLPVFETPKTSKSGIGGIGGAGKYNYYFPLKFNINNALGKVLQFTFAAQMNHTNGAVNNRYYASVETDDTNCTPIYVSEEFYTNTVQTKVFTFQYLLNRPEFTETEFGFRIQGGSSSYGYPNWGFLQRWELIDPSTYLMQRLLAAKNNTTSVDQLEQILPNSSTPNS